jgi:tetratricopeptide (TPR) repeat protein
LLTENAKKEIRRAIFTAFDRQSQRYYEKVFTSLNSASTEERQDSYERFYDEQFFLSMRAVVPGFFRFVTRKILSDPVLRRQRPILFRACLTSLLRPEGILTDEIVSKGTYKRESAGSASVNPQLGYTRRHIQRLFHEQYPETFFRTPDKNHTSIEDERLAPYSSVFTDSALPKTPTTSVAENYREFDYAKATADTETIDRIRLNADLKYVLPEYLEDLHQFKTSCNTQLKRRGHNDDRGEFLASEFSELTPSLIVFHAHFNSILSLEWFRRQRPQTKKRSLTGKYQLNYSALDGEKARELLLGLSMSHESTGFVLQSASYAFSRYGLKEPAVLLLEQCLELDLPPILQGTVCENIAVIYRDNNNYKLMIRFMKIAIEYLRKTEDSYRLCVALKNLAEGEWGLGFKTVASKYFEESARLGDKLPTKAQRFGVYWNLASAARRTGRKDAELAYLKKCLVEFPDDYGDRVMELERRLDELTR